MSGRAVEVDAVSNAVDQPVLSLDGSNIPSGYMYGNLKSINPPELQEKPKGIGKQIIEFNGDSWIQVPNSTMLSSSEVTVMSWFYMSSFRSTVANTVRESRGSWISKRDSYILDPNPDGSVKFWAFVNGQWHSVTSLPGSIELLTWQHWAGSYDGTTLRLYQNGHLVAQNVIQGTLGTSGDVCIGADCGILGRSYFGFGDELRIYNFALSDDEILNLYSIQVAQLDEGKEAQVLVDDGNRAPPGAEKKRDVCSTFTANEKSLLEKVETSAKLNNLLFVRYEGYSIYMNSLTIIPTPARETKIRVLEPVLVGAGTSATDVTVFQDVDTLERFSFATGLEDRATLEIDGQKIFSNIVSAFVGAERPVLLTWGEGATYNSVGKERDTFLCENLAVENVAVMKCEGCLTEDKKCVPIGTRALFPWLTFPYNFPEGERRGEDKTSFRLNITDATRARFFMTGGILSGNTSDIILDREIAPEQQFTLASCLIGVPSCKFSVDSIVPSKDGLLGYIDTTFILYNNGYCSEEKHDFNNQKAANEICKQDYECGSNVCSRGKCISENFLDELFGFFRKIFGNGDRCVETDAGVDFEHNGTTVTSRGELSSDYCDKDILHEFSCISNGKTNETKYACEFGCVDGACKPKPKEEIMLCDAYYESDRGVNSVMPGFLFDRPLENNERRIVAQDSCVNESTLNEAYCDSSDRVRRVDILCPYGCVNNGCALGEKGSVCVSEGNCITLIPEAVCRNYGGFYTQRVARFDGLEKQNGRRIVLAAPRSVCVDENTQRLPGCVQFTSDNSDEYNVIGFYDLHCPEKYVCDQGKCVETVRQAIENFGDVNGDGIVNDVDVQALSILLTQTTISYNVRADIDKDEYLDDYDLYRLRRLVQKTLGIDVRYPIRELTLKTDASLYSEDGSALGTLTETRVGQAVQRWMVEHKKKGASRETCVPPVLNINLKDVKKKDRLLGLSSSSDQGLRYDEFRLVPDCDIWSGFNADNTIREYFLYWLYRSFSVSTTDTIGFAQVRFDASQHAKEFDLQQPYQYLMLQRDNSDKDQIPFTQQFNFARIFEARSKDSNYRVYGSYSNFSRTLFSPLNVTYSDGSVETYEVDADNALRYQILNDFVYLTDRDYSHNEDYGLDGLKGKMSYVPFDFDLSLGCVYWESYANVFPVSLAALPAEKRVEYQKQYYLIVREIFDNPDNLYAMLLALDKYPFRGNVIKMKNEIRLRFYKAALYYGSKEFATSIKQEHKPFLHQQDYMREAKRIVQLDSYDALCYNMRSELKSALDMYG